MATEIRVAGSSGQRPLPQQLDRLDRTRLQRYRENLEFYQGRQWTASSSRRRERHLTFNYAKTMVEKTASYTMSGLGFVVDSEDGSEAGIQRARRAEQVLRQVYEENALAQLDFDNEIDCSVLGDAAYKVAWDAARRRVHVSAPDVQGVFAWRQGGDPSEVWRVAYRYQLGHGEAEDIFGPLAQPGEGEHTVIEDWTAERLEIWLDGALLEESVNPYGFVPFVIYPNIRQPKEPWGISDLAAVREPLLELNRALSQLSMILELSGNPIAVLENVTEAQDIAVQPGAVWEVPEKARAYLLDLLQGGGVGLHVDYVNLILRTLHDLAEVPRSAFGETRQPLSGVALQMELDPLLKKVQRKRLIRSAAFRRRNEMILRILEQHTGETFAPYHTRVVWGPVLPQDRSRLVQDETRLVASGIHSRRTAAGLLDVADPEAEWERWRQEAWAAREVGA